MGRRGEEERRGGEGKGEEEGRGEGDVWGRRSGPVDVL